MRRALILAVLLVPLAAHGTSLGGGSLGAPAVDQTARSAAAQALAAAQAATGTPAPRTFSSATTLDATSDMVEVTNGSPTTWSLRLPACTSATAAKGYGVAKSDANGNPIDLVGTGSDTISGQASIVFSTQWQSVTVKCDGMGTWVRGLH